MTREPATCPAVRICRVDLSAEVALKLRRHGGRAGRRLADNYLSGGRAAADDPGVHDVSGGHIVHEGCHVF
jgi:hypothetical protein